MIGPNVGSSLAQMKLNLRELFFEGISIWVASNISADGWEYIVATDLSLSLSALTEVSAPETSKADPKIHNT